MILKYKINKNKFNLISQLINYKIQLLNYNNN